MVHLVVTDIDKKMNRIATDLNLDYVKGNSVMLQKFADITFCILKKK